MKKDDANHPLRSETYMSYFGTDGIRGKFGVLPITPEFALKLGFAAGKVIKRILKKLNRWWSWEKTRFILVIF